MEEAERTCGMTVGMKIARMAKKVTGLRANVNRSVKSKTDKLGLDCHYTAKAGKKANNRFKDIPKPARIEKKEGKNDSQDQQP